MNKHYLNAAVLLTGLVLWLPIASLLYCWMSQRMIAYVWPFDQWLQVVPYWRMNWLMTVYVIVAGGLPTLFLLFILFSLLTQQVKRTLYGSSGWASVKEQRQGGIVTERTP